MSRDPQSLSRPLRSVFVEGEHYRVDGECWIWTGWIDHQGYGHARGGTEERRAHREAYRAAHGPIPEGFHVHHDCQQPACVNPDHLRAITPTAHFLKHKLFEKTGLTLEDIKEIRRLATVEGVMAPDVAKQYGIHEITVYDYWSSNHWAELLGGEHAGRPVRTCPQCGEDFSERKRHAKFCSALCRRRYNGKRGYRRRNGLDMDAPGSLRGKTRKAA